MHALLSSPRIRPLMVPKVQRAWAILEEKKIPYQYVEVNPYHKPESLLKLNPRGLVPTLEYDKKPLYESNVICEFLEEAYPDHGPKILPADPFQRAVGRIWTDFVTSRVVPGWFRFLQHQSGQVSYTLDETRSEFLGYLKQFADAMDEEGPFFFGKEPYLVDFALAPFAMRFWVFEQFKGGVGIPSEGQGGSDEKSWARWSKWASAIADRKSIKETMSDREHYVPIYKK